MYLAVAYMAATLPRKGYLAQRYEGIYFVDQQTWNAKIIDF